MICRMKRAFKFSLVPQILKIAVPDFKQAARLRCVSFVHLVLSSFSNRIVFDVVFLLNVFLHGLRVICTRGTQSCAKIDLDWLV